MSVWFHVSQRAAESAPKDCSAITLWDPTTALTLPGKSCHASSCYWYLNWAAASFIKRHSGVHRFIKQQGTDKRLLATHRTRGRVRLRWGHITVVPHLTEGHLSWAQKHFGALGLTKEAFRCSSCLLSVTRMMQESVPLWINKGLNMTTAVFYHWPLSSSAQEMRGYVLC